MAMRIAPRTVVEAFLPHEGDVSLSEVYDAANLAGLDDQPVRLAIRRLVAAGDIVTHGRGRRGAMSLTDAGRERLLHDRQSLALAFAQDAGSARWDGRWRLIAVSVPESHRAVRDTVRTQLLERGAAVASTGLYVSPHDLVRSLPRGASHYLTTATTADVCVHGVRDPLRIAETLWPSAPIVAAYRHIEEVLDDDADRPEVVRALMLAEALERAMRDDPLLPLELRRGPWAPTAIRGRWARRWDTLRETDAGGVYAGWWPPGRPLDEPSEA